MINFDDILKNYKTKTCILSVKKLDDGTYGNIKVVAGNQAHADDIAGITGHPFVPGCPYEMCFPKDMNFEDFAARCAWGGQPLHTYVNLYQMGLWLNMFMIPFFSDEPNIGYCIYSYDVAPRVDEDKMADLSGDTAAKVLTTCIKFRGSTDFLVTVNEIISDIRDICEADHCAIILLDRDEKMCRVMGKSMREGSGYESISNFFSPEFYDMVLNWENTLQGSTCIIIKNEQDMEEIKKRDPVWHESLVSAGVESLVLFPLKHGTKLLGYIWALNFNTENTVAIKETLELTSFFVGSEVANYLLVKRMEILSSIDLLTGTKNRNIMNNRIDRIISGKDVLKEPYAVIFADLNGLKRVNDTEGHNKGDDMLRDAAALIQSVFFDSEVYRAGGDEFMVIATDMTPNILSTRISDLRDRADKTDNVRLAIGAVCSSDEPNILKAMRIADQFMYADKDRFYKAHPELKYR